MGWRLYFPKEWDFPLYGNAHRKHLDKMGQNLQSGYGKVKLYFIRFLNRRENSLRLGAWTLEAVGLFGI